VTIVVVDSVEVALADIAVVGFLAELTVLAPLGCLMKLQLTNT